MPRLRLGFALHSAEGLGRGRTGGPVNPFHCSQAAPLPWLGLRPLCLLRLQTPADSSHALQLSTGEAADNKALGEN